MGYGIRFVDDSVLPKGHDFLFVELPDGALIFYRESAVTPETLEDSWAAYRALGGPRPTRPTPASETADPSAMLELVHSVG